MSTARLTFEPSPGYSNRRKAWRPARSVGGAASMSPETVPERTAAVAGVSFAFAAAAGPGPSARVSARPTPSAARAIVAAFIFPRLLGDVTTLVREHWRILDVSLEATRPALEWRALTPPGPAGTLAR